MNVRCEDGYLLYRENDTCVGVRSCGEGYYLAEDEFERKICEKCHPLCQKCENSEICTECLVKGGNPENHCSCRDGYYETNLECQSNGYFFCLNFKLFLLYFIGVFENNLFFQLSISTILFEECSKGCKDCESSE